MKIVPLKILLGYLLLCLGIVACGGSGTDADAGDSTGTTNNNGAAITPENLPWNNLFPKGLDSITLKATDCTYITSLRSAPNNVTTTAVANATVTYTLGSSSIRVKSVAQGMPAIQDIVVGDSIQSTYKLTLLSAARSIASVLVTMPVDSLDRTALLRPDVSDSQKQNFIHVYEEGNKNSTLYCRNIVNPITRDSLNVAVSQRVAVFMQRSPEPIVYSSVKGCVVPSGARQFTYSLNRNGEAKFNDVLLPLDWLTAPTNTNSKYVEITSFEANGASTSSMSITTNAFETANVFFTTGRDASFSHRCS